MEGHNKTEIGNFPNDWNVGRIDDFFEIQQGKQVSKSNRVGENQKPFLRTSNIYWGKVVFEELDYMNFSKDEEARYRLKKNDLLVCEGGDIGRTAIWNQEVENCYYQNHLHRLRAKTDDIDPLFILQWLEYSFVIGKVYFGRANVTTIPNLSKSRLSELIIPHPPLPEQRKIAHVLSTVQKAIEQQDNLIRTTTELKKALMQKFFTEGTRGEPQKETEIGLVPESWEVKKLKDYCELITKGSSPKWQGFNYCDKGLLFVRSQNIGWGVIENEFAYLPIEFNEIQKRSILKENDVLINLVGASIGRVAIAPKYFEGANSNQAVALVRLSEENLKERFLMHFLLTNVGQTVIKSNEKAIARANISLTDISNFRIPIPTIEEQVLISNSIDILGEKINILNSKKQTLTALFKTLLHELMTGQRRVHEMEFDVLQSKTL